MDPKVKDLIYGTGIDEKLATLLIEFTGGDTAGAQKIVEAMPKDYLAVKVRYMAHKSHYFGVILLIINLKKRNIDNVILIADKNKNASQIDSSLKFDDFKTKIIDYIKDQGPDMEMMGRLREAIDTPHFQEAVFQKLDTDNKFDTEQLKLVFAELFSRIMTEQNCAIKIETEYIDLFTLLKSDHTYVIKKEENAEKAGKEEKVDEGDHDSSQKEEIHIRNISLVLLKIEPVVSPVMGIASHELKVDDEILVKIIDEREIGDYLAKLLNAKKDDELVPIPAVIKDIQKQEDTENLMIIVEFGPGIAGKMYIPPEIKIETPFSTESNKSEAVSYFKISPLWVIFILIIFFFIILLFTIFVGR